MSVIDFVGGLVKPIATLIDKLHTSGEEKGQLVNEMEKIQNAAATKLLEYESQVLALQTQVIVAEAQGQSWLQRNWRPVTMLTFLVLVVCDSFGWLTNRLAPEAWVLLQIGLGGYVIGRSVEKIAPSMMDKFGKGK